MDNITIGQINHLTGTTPALDRLYKALVAPNSCTVDIGIIVDVEGVYMPAEEQCPDDFEIWSVHCGDQDIWSFLRNDVQEKVRERAIVAMRGQL